MEVLIDKIWLDFSDPFKICNVRAYRLQSRVSYLWSELYNTTRSNLIYGK